MKSDDTSSDDGSEDEHGQDTIDSSEAKKDGSHDNLERLRRQKRLAMNRESARNRRKRKKMMLETLEKQVEEMNKVNQNLRVTNEALTTRVAHLEGELGVARSTIAMLSGNSQQPSFLGGSGLPGAGAFLQRQGLGGGGGLGGSSFLSDPSAFQYMQLLQQQQQQHQQQQQPGGGAGADGGGPDSELLRLARERQGLQGRLGGAGGGSGLTEHLGGGDNPLPNNSGLGGLDDLRRLGGGAALRGGTGSFLENNRGSADISRQLAALRQQQGGSVDPADLLDKKGNPGSRTAGREP